MRRVAILILGMHRSGTSSLAWACGRLGAALPADGIAPSGQNAKGYHESEALVRADDQLLRACRSSWFDPRPLDWSRLPAAGLRSRKDRIREAIAAAWGDAPLLAIKDPRQCRFAPVVADVLTEMAIEPRALLALRPAAEVAASLARRDGTSAAYGCLLWLRHMLDAERDTRGMTRAVASYDGLLADWRGTLARIAPLAGREGWTPDAGEAAEIEAFLDPALRHHRVAEEPDLCSRAGGSLGATAPPRLPPGFPPKYYFGGGPAREHGLDEPLRTIVAEAEAAFADLLARDDAAARDRLDAIARRLADEPRLLDDVVHDELRHRRMPAAAPDEEPPADPPPAPPPPRAAPAPDPTGDARLIRDSGLFDEAWYMARYPDVAESGLDPVDHYLAVGAREGRNPSALFDTAYYARQMARRG